MIVEEILSSDWDVRRRVASNSNTTVEVLNELAKDSDWDVRRRVASNPNTTGFALKREWILGNNYVATQGTNNLWYKYKGVNIDFYTCGCFIGSRQQLINRIIYDGMYNERMAILNLLDAKFNEIFNK